MAKQKVYGPYRVKPLGDGMYEVVEMTDNCSSTRDAWEQLRPRKTYVNRQPAYGKCLRLNSRWQQENIMEDELLEYWQNATN